ncbi:MAG: CoA transferase [Candidatus Bathyarchaeia archaeon]|nr:CoA transferase [Candidatus Bathyarchaeota archaeon]
MIKAPLEGIKVLDFTHEVAGPHCTMLLGDLGAEIIKVEVPGRGDRGRHWVGMKETIFITNNRNKRSIVLDLKSEEGRKIAFELAKKVDVLVENFVPGTLKKFGLDYESVKKVNPKIVYCSISGYGQDGPYSSRPAWDPIIEAESGLMSLTGDPEPCLPSRIPASIIDYGAGVYAALAIVSALLYREKTGKGQMIDLSMLDVSALWAGYWIAYSSITGEVRERMGSAAPVGAPYQVFRTKDSYIFIAAFEDEHWKKFCQVIKAEDLLKDPLYATRESRATNRKTLIEKLSKIISTWNTKDLVDALVAVGVPCAPVNNTLEVANHPQLLHRNMIVEIEYKGQKVKIPGIPFKFSECPLKIRHLPPADVGQHTEEVLRELGLKQ